MLQQAPRNRLYQLLALTTLIHTTLVPPNHHQMSQLYSFGLTAHTADSSPSISTPTPSPFAAGPNVKILWASWCDVIYITSTHPEAEFRYEGNSLNPDQAEHIQSLKQSSDLRFFGTHLSHGVLGYIAPHTYEITFFATPKSLRDGASAIRTYSFKQAEFDMLAISVTAANHVLMSVGMRGFPDLSAGYVVEMASLEEFEEYQSSVTDFSTSWGYSVRLPFAPSQWCVNAASLTALDQDGKIYTFSLDHRYPKCLGRSTEDHDHHARQIPYFSETKIIKIAAGGYYTAAITEDGELYVWGQANPTPAEIKSELEVLKEASDDEDEFVRSVGLEIDGRPAKAVDVSVGWGHILVVAEVEDTHEKKVTAVLAAGHNEHGQLARSGKFVESFVELPKCRGWNIEQLVCAGFSSYIVKKGLRT